MKNLILALVAIFTLGIPMFTPIVAKADTAGSVCKGIEATGGTCSTNPGEAENKVNSLVSTIINVFSWIVGVVSVIMIIFGGFRYITSGGDSGKVSSAKNTILYAIIGLIIVALAQVIVVFVLDQVA